MARVFEVLAWVLGIGMFIIGLTSGFLGDGGGASLILGLIMGVFGGILFFIFLYAFAQFIYVLLDIERNTRATVKALYEEVEKDEGVEKVANVEAEEGE
jgi:hypothetical protein